MQENDNFLCSTNNKRYKICPKMEIPTTKYLADYLYVVHEDVPFRYYRKVSAIQQFPTKILQNSDKTEIRQ